MENKIECSYIPPMHSAPRRRIWTVIICMILTACASSQAPHPDIQTIATSQHLTFQVITARNGYQVVTLSKFFNSPLPIHIYLEGDGHAWNHSDQPSNDPTPQDLTVINLISQDKNANILYVARPCQFVWSQQCQVTDWTNGRYSEKMISAIQDAVLAYPASNRELIGYSGGAVVALLLLNRVPNITGLVTVAGNLAPDQFSVWHHVSPLTQSLPTQSALLASATRPQRHWVGAEDDVIPPELSSQMLTPINHSPFVQQRVLPGASHHNGWQAHWAEIIAEPLPNAAN